MVRSSSDFLSPEEIAQAKPAELAEAFLPLAKAQARDMYPDDPDAIQDASLALVEAARTYDADKGPFAPWARLYIKRTLVRGRRLRERIIRIPQDSLSRLSLVLGAKEAIETERGSATLSEIADWADVSEEEVGRLLALPSTMPPLSPVSNDQDGTLTWEDTMASPDDIAEASEIRADIVDSLDGNLEAAADVDQWLTEDGTDKGLAAVVDKWWPDKDDC